MVSDPTQNYEQLEFLGDAVIDYIVSRRLLIEFPDSSEGVLTEKRSELVQKTCLAKMGDSLGLLEHISATPSLNLTQNEVSQNQLANLFEAVVGAMYLDGGLKPCERLIERTVWNYKENAWQSTNYKGLLIEYCQANQLEVPRFVVKKTTGPEHRKVFEVAVHIGNQTFPSGTGTTKKAAEQVAAQMTLDSISP